MMSIYSLFILMLMILLHIIEDFHLQGILANLKQISWWKEQTKDKKYKNDYKVGLIIHAIENTCFVILPIFIDILISDFLGYCTYWDVIGIILCFIFLTFCHYFIDNQKANEYRINLIQDQIAHFLCIIFVWFCYNPILGIWI